MQFGRMLFFCFLLELLRKMTDNATEEIYQMSKRKITDCLFQKAVFSRHYFMKTHTKIFMKLLNRMTRSVP